jgi:hypothetical protein
MQPIKAIFLFFALIGLSLSMMAQENTDPKSAIDFNCEGICEITLNNGKVYIGTIKEVRELVIVISNEDGLSLEIPKNQIKSIVAVSKARINDGVYWSPMPVENTYFFGSSARNQEKGDLIFSNSYILLNGVDYGVTNWLSVGVGLELITTFSGEPPLGYLRAKVGFPVTEKITLGANLFHIGVPEEGAFTLSTLAATYGVAENHLTVGLGFALNEGSAGSLLTVSYLNRFSKRTAFITENYFLSEDVGANLLSYGFRFFGDNLSVDFGFFNNAEISEGIIIGIPYIGFQIKL